MFVYSCSTSRNFVCALAQLYVSGEVPKGVRGGRISSEEWHVTLNAPSITPTALGNNMRCSWLIFGLAQANRDQTKKGLREVASTSAVLPFFFLCYSITPVFIPIARRKF
jgi:hypothetical protein